MDPLPVYIGYDPREDDAYTVCRRSLIARSSLPLHVIKLNRRGLMGADGNGIFARGWDVDSDGRAYDDLDHRPFSTAFAFTRFCVPLLQQYEGWAIFCDCDFLWRADVKGLYDLRNPRYAVQVVQHDFRPPAGTKMDDQVQSPYYRKNWSSLILWNCSHPANLRLTREAINTKAGSWLHGFQWLEPQEIGELPVEWNWLVGHSPPVADVKAAHFTDGGPWFEGYGDVPFAGEWMEELERADNDRLREMIG